MRFPCSSSRFDVVVVVDSSPPPSSSCCEMLETVGGVLYNSILLHRAVKIHVPSGENKHPDGKDSPPSPTSFASSSPSYGEEDNNGVDDDDDDDDVVDDINRVDHIVRRSVLGSEEEDCCKTEDPGGSFCPDPTANMTFVSSLTKKKLYRYIW